MNESKNVRIIAQFSKSIPVESMKKIIGELPEVTFGSYDGETLRIVIPVTGRISIDTYELQFIADVILDKICEEFDVEPVTAIIRNPTDPTDLLMSPQEWEVVGPLLTEADREEYARITKK